MGEHLEMRWLWNFAIRKAMPSLPVWLVTSSRFHHFFCDGRRAHTANYMIGFLMVPRPAHFPTVSHQLAYLLIWIRWITTSEHTPWCTCVGSSHRPLMSSKKPTVTNLIHFKKDLQMLVKMLSPVSFEVLSFLWYMVFFRCSPEKSYCRESELSQSCAIFLGN